MRIGRVDAVMHTTERDSVLTERGVCLWACVPYVQRRIVLAGCGEAPRPRDARIDLFDDTVVCFPTQILPTLQ